MGSSKNQRLYSKPVLIGLIIMIGLLARGTFEVYQKEKESRKNVAMVKREYDALMERRDLLKKETEKLATEEGIEAALREKYQVSKEGESVLVVVDKPLPPPPPPEQPDFFSKMWNNVSSIFKSDEEVPER